MARQLTPEEIVTLRVLKEKKQSNRQIAWTLQVSEGTVRYHLSRLGKLDGRQNKPRKAEAVADAIDLWLRSQQAPLDAANLPVRPANVRGLFEWLQNEHHYQGSYKSVLRFIRAKYPKPRLRPFRRLGDPNDGSSALPCAFLSLCCRESEEAGIKEVSVNQGA